MTLFADSENSFAPTAVSPRRFATTSAMYMCFLTSTSITMAAFVTLGNRSFSSCMRFSAYSFIDSMRTSLCLIVTSMLIFFLLSLHPEVLAEVFLADLRVVYQIFTCPLSEEATIIHQIRAIDNR